MPAPLALLALALAGPNDGERPYAGRKLVVMVEERTFGAWPALEREKARFEAEHPGLAVELLTQGGAVGQQDKSRFMLAGELQLDVTRIDVTELGAFLAEGALIDLQPYFDADPTWDAGDYLAAIDGMRGPAGRGMRDERGHLYGLTSTFTPYVMYFNRDLLAAAGVEPPRAGWTWDDLLDACRRTTRDLDGDGRPDQWGISLTQWLQAVTPWIWQAGGDLLDEAGERSRLGEPEAVEALSFVRSLLHDEKVASFDASFENQLSQGLFMAGRAAFYGPVGYWETYRLKAIDAFEWDVAPLPKRAREATAIAMTAFVVPRTAREPELAYRFVRRLAGDDYQRWLAEIGNGVPALARAARSESFLKPHVAPASEHVFLDVLSTARFMPPLANWRRVEDLCQSELQAILLYDRCDVAAACARMAAKTDEFLARERERRSLPRAVRGALEIAVSAALIATLAAFIALRGRRPGRAGLREERAGYAMLAPWALGFAALFFGPAVASAVLAACEWSPLRPLADLRYVGLDNAARLAYDATFHTSLAATAEYVALSVPLGLALALGLALLVSEDGAWASALRTALFVPAIVSPVIVAAVWKFLLDPDRGLVDGALRALGVTGPAWTRDPGWVVPSFVLMSLWSVGGQMLVFVAALKARDRTLDEAARVDGAGPLRRFAHVTLPQLGPVILFNFVLGLVGAAQVFAQPYLVTRGGPGDASRFLVLYLYESAFRHLDMGYASAIAWALFALLALAVGLAVRASRRWIHYAARGGST
jgi:multiple sugar transport system permease protein